MTFTANIPASGQSLGSSRLQVLNNFSNYNTVMSVNHVAPNASGQGKHKFVEMPVQGSTPATLAGEGGIWTQTIAGVSIPLYQRDANTTVNQPMIPMATATFITRNTNGACTLVMGYNVTSVTRSAQGVYQVALALTLPFSAGVSEYGLLTGYRGNAANIYVIVPNTATANSFILNLYLPTSGAATDATGDRITFSVIQ